MMRYAYNMRKISRSSLQLLIAAGSLLVASSAAGQDGGAGAAGAAGSGGSGGAPVTPCDPNTLWCSNGSAELSVESNDRLPGDIDTGWWPECPPPDIHCDDEIIQFRALVAFDPTKTGGPIYSVKMDTKVDARWPDPEWIDLTLPPAGQTDGTFKVAHTMTPEISLYFDTIFYTGEISLDASVLVNYLPGSQFSYYATNSTKFKPWGFGGQGGVDLNVKGTDWQTSKLFSITFAQIEQMLGTDVLDGVVEGDFSFNASSDTDFHYETTAVDIMSATGPINFADGMTQVPSLDGDYLLVIVQPKGIIRYDGIIKFLPVISITSPISLSFPIEVGLEVDYGNASIPVVFNTQEVRIPLPNVFVPSTKVNFGKVATGSKSDPKKVTIENTGELGAILEFSSDDSQFRVVGSSAAQMGPDGEEYELELEFRPTKSGVQNGTITVTSNDPDTPIQEIPVSGTGEGEDIPEPEDGGTGGNGGTGGVGGGGGNQGSVFDDSGDDGGCGCRTPSNHAGTAGASLALLGLAAMMLRRRR